MGAQPTPWVAIETLADNAGIPAGDRDRLHYFIGALDQVYLQFLNEARGEP